MAHRKVLDIAAVADDDAIDVAAQHGIAPDRRIAADLYVADELRRIMDVAGFAEFGKAVEVRVKGACF
jgi:hypothetical protein